GVAVAGAGFDVADVGVVVADHGGDLLQDAGAVVAEHGQLHRIAAAAAVFALLAPLHRDLPLHVIEQVDDVGAVPGVHRHALATGDVSHDLFPADGIATSRAVDEQIILAFDLERAAIAAEHPAHHAAETRLLVLRRDRGLGRRKFAQHLPRRELAEANAGHQVVGPGNAIFLGYALVSLVGDILQRDAVLARFLFNQLAADFERALALVDIEPVPDLLPRPRRLHESQPVAAGLVPGLGHDLHDFAVVQLVAQRHDAPVHPRPGAGVPDFGVDGVGEVHGSGLARKNHHFALGGEGIDLFRVEVDLEGGEE